MDHERWRKVESIFHKALEADESRRRSVLEESCADDESLRREVESLLAHHKNSEISSRRQRLPTTPTPKAFAPHLPQQPCDLT